MSEGFTRRDFLAATATGAASLLLFSQPAIADEVRSDFTPVWIESQNAERIFNEISAEHPELSVSQMCEIVFSQTDPLALAGIGETNSGIEALSLATGTATALIEQAQSHIGYRSVGTNKFNEWYGWTTYEPWCDAFVSYCADDSGNAGIIGKFAYCPSHVNFFKNKGQWRSRGTDAKPGDIIFYDWNGDGLADHVGIVEWCDGSTVGTIEGNTNAYPGEVARQSYGVWNSTILGYGRPSYVQLTLRYRVGIKQNLDTAWQRWRRIEHAGKVGWRNMGSGRMIDVPDGIGSSRTLLHTYPLPSNDIPNNAQLFEEVSITHGGVAAKKYKYNGLSFDIQDGKYDDGTLMMLWEDGGSDYPQAFLPVDLGGGVFILVNFGSYKVLTEFEVYE